MYLRDFCTRYVYNVFNCKKIYYNVMCAKIMKSSRLLIVNWTGKVHSSTYLYYLCSLRVFGQVGRQRSDSVFLFVIPHYEIRIWTFVAPNGALRRWIDPRGRRAPLRALRALLPSPRPPNQPELPLGAGAQDWHSFPALRPGWTFRFATSQPALVPLFFVTFLT